ncbi:right-handed parallel beta-helix repeat-containing protein [bacterium]|nr:right-handed parallel beta-helix repeat-containing protein [bacterium]
MKRGVFIACLSVCIIIPMIPASAQPSGGPYGPVHQTYDLPEKAKTIYYVAPDGKTKSQGKTPERPTSLKAAIERVKSGDAIIMRAGIYRTGNLTFNQGIIIQPYKDETPVFKGTYIADQWEDLGNGLWQTRWSPLFPAQPADWWNRRTNVAKTPLHRFNNDMVFVDGELLQSAGWGGDVDEHSYYIDYEAGLVYLGADPTHRLVEITAFDIALKRTTKKCHGKKPDRIGPVIRGITFTQYAYRALEIEGTYPEGISDESGFGKDVVGTILEHCTLSYCSRVAAYLKGDSLTVRHCRVQDTSTEGLYIISSSDVLLEKNIFARNNIEEITGYFPASVKIFNQCHRVTCLDNLVIDHPCSNGIWYDVGNADGLFINNWVENVGHPDQIFSPNHPWGADSGFFVEISKGAVCAGNVFVNCGNGIFILNSSDVKILQNTLVNSTVSIARTSRIAAGDRFGWHASTGPDVDERDGHILMNNLLTGDENFHRPLLTFWQPKSLCDRLHTPQVQTLDHNVYVRASVTSTPLIYWSPVKHPEDCQAALESPEDLTNLHPAFSANSRYFFDYHGPLFKCRELGNYQLSNKFTGSEAAAPLPATIEKFLGKSSSVQYIGAYPVIRTNQQ